MNVKFLKSVVTLKDVSEIDPNKFYVLRIPAGTQFDGLEQIRRCLEQAGLNRVVIMPDDYIFLEGEEKSAHENRA